MSGDSSASTRRKARALHERAIALNPNLALAWCFSGLAHSYLGHHEEALRRITQAVRLSPSDPHGFFFDMALVMPHLMCGDYVNAVETGRRAIEMKPFFSSTYKGYLAALGLMNRTREAAEVLDRLMVLEPGFSVREAVERSPLSRPEDIARYAEGLRRAGLRRGRGRTLEGVEPWNTAVFMIRHSKIDLAAEAPQSRAAARDASHASGRMGNETIRDGRRSCVADRMPDGRGMGTPGGGAGIGIDDAGRGKVSRSGAVRDRR